MNALIKLNLLKEVLYEEVIYDYGSMCPVPVGTKC